VTFKDLKKRVSLEATQQQQQQLACLNDYIINHFGFGMLKNTRKRISQIQREVKIISF
jgi:hypothetical protein